MPFELYTRKGKGAESRVSIKKRGTFVLNDTAYDELGRPEFVELLFDAERQAIAFRPAKDSPHAYPVRSHYSYYEITGRGFTTYHGIDTSITRSYAPRLEDGMLVICLQDEQIG